MKKCTTTSDREVKNRREEYRSLPKHYNPPGRKSLKYRIGTHSTFLRSMMASLPMWEVPDGPNKGTRPLSSELCTRDGDDPSIALMNAWATVADVLTFYQERILNEGYLQTATEHRSVLELARSIGYELSPGVAAGTFLAFMVEEVPGTPEFKVQGMPSMPDSVVVPKGTQVQSVPDPGQLPQTFETSCEIVASSKWNAICPRLRRPQTLSSKAKVVYLNGLESEIKAGDLVLFVEQNNGEIKAVPKRVIDVILESKLKWTCLHVDSLPENVPQAKPEVGAQKQRYAHPKTDPKSLDRDNVTGLVKEKVPWRENDLESLISILGWDAKSMVEHINKTRPKVLMRQKTLEIPSTSAKGKSGKNFSDRAMSPDEIETTRSGILPPPNPGIYIFKVISSPFGHNAPLWRSLPKEQRSLYSNWDGANEPSIIENSNKEPYQDSDLFFERSLPEVIQDSWILLRGPFKTTLNLSGTVEGTLKDDAVDAVIKGVMEGDTLSVGGIIKWTIESTIIKKGETKRSFSGTANGTIAGGDLEGAMEGTIKGILRKRSLRNISIKGTIKDQRGSAKRTIEVTGSGTIELIAEEDKKTFKGTISGTVNEEKLGSHIKAYRVSGVTERTLTDFTLTGKATGIALKNEDGSTDAEKDNLSKFKIRSTTIYASSQPLELTDFPVEDPIGKGTSEDDHLTLDGMYLGLQEGQHVAITGERKDLEGVIGTEVAVLSEIQTGDGFITIFFDSGLKYTYIRDTVTINANVVPATHGETVKEVMGSGDGSRINQRFALKRNPLTYVSAPNPQGIESTLGGWVDGVKWKESASLYDLELQSENFIIRIDEDQNAHVIFGDGTKGAGLPTGMENVEAVYRTGIGSAGMLAADRLTLLKTRPHGIRSVTNPLSTSGATDPEDMEHARSNAPRKILNMGRIVSLKDFEDFARLFPGIGKAQAVVLLKGETGFVHLTVATAKPTVTVDIEALATHALDIKSDLYSNMVKAINVASGSVQHFFVDTYRPRFFNLEAKVDIDSRYKPELVISKVKTALESSFSFDQRDFGQPVTSSEILGTIQGVTGVQAVDLDKFYIFGEELTMKNVLESSRAKIKREQINRADLLLINPKGITLEVANL